MHGIATVAFGRLQGLAFHDLTQIMRESLKLYVNRKRYFNINRLKNLL